MGERDYDKAASYVAGTGEMSDENRGELKQTLAWIRFTTSGFTGETFDNVTVTDYTAKASYTRTTVDEDDFSSFSYSVELDLKKEAGGVGVEDRSLLTTPPVITGRDEAKHTEPPRSAEGVCGLWSQQRPLRQTGVSAFRSSSQRCPRLWAA